MPANMHSANKDAASDPDFFDLCEDFFVNLRRDIVRSITGLPFHIDSPTLAPFEIFDSLSSSSISSPKISLLDVIAPQWEFFATRMPLRDISLKGFKGTPGVYMTGIFQIPLDLPLSSTNSDPESLESSFVKSLRQPDNDKNKQTSYKASFRSTTRILQPDGSYLTKIISKKIDSGGSEDISEEEFIEPVDKSLPLSDAVPVGL
ncbi:hypothetical protein NEOLI_000905 [Neolecta irregularis DAH-3]|uniref:Uncharacterized protein n=1 Tax=Neolecta irregularis (strain DAH-3) TaxID=1198029 RepID=A0A1U7LUP5_NEOID|nr:hypothetical protein NEOLI_000905 [Neolecta irregularis DAH-3]|eukprot:OLL26349.1 hypothetical protein NEOLI_000905 [Neolecta irregularis DAH-3]